MNPSAGHRKNLRILIASGIVMILFCGFFISQSPSPGYSTILKRVHVVAYKEKVIRIQEEFEQLYDPLFSPGDPGGAILVRKNGQNIFLKSYGVADLETLEPVTAQTVFNTGSISKTFVAYGILILDHEGLLSLNDSILKFFDAFENKAVVKDVKIKHLLTHTSGLPDLRKVQDEFDFYLTAKDQENFAPLYQTQKLHFHPGERFEYSNPAFNGLALIIEKITQQPWQNFIHDRVFKPVGMYHSTITDGDHPREGVAHAYIPHHGTYIELDYGEEPTFAAAGNGGVWSSVLDLARYEEAIRNAVFLPAEVLSPSREVVKFPTWKDTQKPQVGMSWFIADEDSHSNEFGLKIISHTGWQGGFRGFMISIPEKKVVYIGLFNRPIKTLSESFNPFAASRENKGDLRIEGIRILQSHNWLDN